MTTRISLVPRCSGHFWCNTTAGSCCNRHLLGHEWQLCFENTEVFCRKCNVTQEMVNDRNSGQVDILHSLVVKIRLGNYCRWRVMISGLLACEQPFAGTPNSEGVSLLTRIMYYSRGVLEWKRRVQKAEVLCLFLAVLRWDYFYRCKTGNFRYLERVLYDIMFVDRICILYI